MAKKRSRKNIIKKLDDLVRMIIRLRDEDTCQWCSRKVFGKDSQVSHVRSRKYYSTRWALSNVKLLCAKCHFRWHDNPIEAAAWFDSKFPARRSWILEEGRKPICVFRDSDLIEIETNLKNKLAELQND
jgi:hypothetical protein